MADSTFRTQIDEDLAYYKEIRPNVPNIDKPEWAFNIWVLDKLFGEDFDTALTYVIDYNDSGIDCYIWHEETKDLFLIQNKYFATSAFTATYFNANIDHAYNMLQGGTYTHCQELQQIFTKNKDCEGFRVYHYFYVTNEDRKASVNKAVKKFNEKSIGQGRFAEVFYLDDIREAFFGEPLEDVKTFKTTVLTVNGSTVLNVNNKDYNLDLEIDAKYVMLPVVELYKMLRSAEKEKYPIFDSNIREYLGKGRRVNKNIIKTLEDVDERKRFFFYNNGITITCESISSPKPFKDGSRLEILNPQIVNGCQTVSSIREVLDSYPDSSLDKEFKDSFVMAKVLVIPEVSDDESHFDELRKLIVKYNNSQNSIDEKTFTANETHFRRIKNDFEAYGFLVLTKQSDRVSFGKKYKGHVDVLRTAASSKLKQFGLDGKVKNLRDFMVPLDKLLQIILCFVGDSQQASQKKGALLDSESNQSKLVTSAIVDNNDLTTHRLLDLYLLYLRSEYERSKNATDNRTPVTWFLIEGFSVYECNRRDFAAISNAVANREDINRLMMLYRATSSGYLKRYISTHEGRGYNDMIKEKLDYNEFDNARDVALGMMSDMSV